jgi:hypothetical protein
MDALNIWNLKAGTAVRVVKDFKDYYGAEFKEGTVLHYEKRDYLPYHEGHTVYFREATMYLCDTDDMSAIVRNEGHEFYQMVLE